MLSEPRSLPPLSPGAPWTPTTGKDIKGGRNQRQAPDQRSSFSGLEVKPELVWEDWDLRQEFTKTLVLKNTQSKLQKLHIRPPVSEFFTTTIPQTIFISPGISLSVPIIFRPLQLREYEDSIEFRGRDGSFGVCLRAPLPCHALEVPDSVLLPLCAVQHSSRATFPLKNVSKLQTCFQWRCTAPFQLSPEQGLLEPGQECHVTVVFQPQQALLYQQQAFCRFGEEGDKAASHCSVLLQGPAKYPCLQLRHPGAKDNEQPGDPVLRFDSVAVGESLQKHVNIFNPSPVPATFSLSPLSDAPLLGSEFSCDVTRGTVAPGKSLKAAVTYAPAVVDAVSVQYLSLKCEGAITETQLKLTGNCIGPNVSLSSSAMDFGRVEEGGAAVQTGELINSSAAEAVYQWDLDCRGHSVFSIRPACGTLGPHGRATFQAVYRPTQAMAHRRRVTCLILHTDPVFLELIGTCHSELHQSDKSEGLQLRRSQDPQDPLSAAQQEDSLHSDPHRGLTPPEQRSQQTPDSAGVVTPSEESDRSSMEGPDSLSSTSSVAPVSAVPSELQFDHQTSSSSLTYPVSIINHARKEVSLVWTAAHDSPFSVSPSSRDLAPLKSTRFKVTYEPKELNTLHAAQLECFAVQKDNQQSEEPYPYCVTLRVTGHAFQPGQHFIPCCSLKPPLVVFPPFGVRSHQTALLQNCGDLPLTFCLNDSSTLDLAGSVSVLPSCGLIQPGDHQILTLQSLPIAEERPTQELSVQLRLNAAEHTKELTVAHVVEKLSVSLEGGGGLHFHPTAVGSRTQRSHHIRNRSPLPLRYQWSIPEPDQQLICVEPDAGELHPNERSVQIWSFRPLVEKTHTLQPTLTFWPSQTPGRNQSQLPLNVVGIGCKGFIEAEEAVVDIGAIMVGSSRSVEVRLVNSSPCSVDFCLSVQQTLQDEDPIDGPETFPSALQLDCETGTLASHSTMLLQSTVTPHRRAHYLWTISYQTLNASGCWSSSLRAVCELRADAVFPTLKVTDVRGGGSVCKRSKLHLWRLFSLDSLNRHLLSSPSPAELTYKTPTRHSLRSHPGIFTEVTLDFNFSAAPLNSEPSTFALTFYNPGSISVDWAFLFPEDQQIELESWAKTRQFSSTVLHQMKVRDNRLFSISPRSGTLLPGQQGAVHFSYSHDIAGTYRFPVVLKLSHGREILLNFQGLTVERGRPYLHFASKQHVFTSVTIGESSPPTQVSELHNGGAVPLHYEVDSAVLTRLRRDNFNHPVLCCLNPEGDVLPGETAMLEWIFSPLEAKTYEIDVPIHVRGGDSALVKLQGCGLSSPAFDCSDTETPGPQRLPLPGQAAFLSEDSIALNHIPVCSRSSRILFLSNVSHTDTVQYTWDNGNQQVVQIRPAGGRLSPGESALCVLTFTSTRYPMCYQLDFICQIDKEAELVQYRDALQRWEEEKRRQQDEFTIADKKMRERQPLLIDQELQERGGAPVRRGPPLSKYKTLPPIGSGGCCETADVTCALKAERQAQRDAAKVWKRPERPRPALLHLEVTAQSHGLQEYLTRLPDHFYKHYGPLRSDESQKPESAFSRTAPPAGLPTTHGPERDMATEVLTALLSGLLDDPTFTQPLIASASTPITYRPEEPGPSRCSSSSSSSSRVAGPGEQHDTVDSEGTAGCAENVPPAQDAPHAGQLAPADVSEDVLLNTLQNLMMEAVRGELVLTAHPHTVTLPPAPARR